MHVPRNLLVDPDNPMYYHLVSKCVRNSFLCGKDPITGRNYEHRKEALIERMLFLAQYFAVSISAYTIMSNHFHLVTYFDPTANQRWSDAEVARRWVNVCKPRIKDQKRLGMVRAMQQRELLANPQKLANARKSLGCLSTFMKFLKQPIARRANIEDGCTGHFFEGRFYSGALVDDEAVLAAMAYVDLNPVRAKIVASIAHIQHTSIQARLQAIRNDPERLEQALEPIVSGLEDLPPAPNIRLGAYVDLLKSLARNHRKGTEAKTDPERRWLARLAVLGKQQVVYGTALTMQLWFQRRGWETSGAAIV